MNWILENWFLLIIAIAVAIAVGLAVYRFIELPTPEKLKKVQEWLLFAVTMAEVDYGNGTGVIKLRAVYDQFLVTFPWLVKIITFDTFSGLVDQALDEMRKLLESNASIKRLVAGDEQILNE